MKNVNEMSEEELLRGIAELDKSIAKYQRANVKEGRSRDNAFLVFAGRALAQRPL